ncbi:MAG: tetratricopeptide repeat protein [Nitrospiraceae bacterium]
MRARLILILLLISWPLPLQAQGTSTDRTIQLYQRMLHRNPNDARTYYRLGDAYIQKARESGDPTYFTLAEESLKKCLTLAPTYGGAARHLAFVLYSKHAFEDAAVQAAKAIELDPKDNHAYGILGDAYLETGKYEQARQAYEKMIKIRKDLHSYSRLSGLKSLRGETKGAIEDLKRAIREGKANGRPNESIAWTQWQLGSEQFALGHLKEAEAQYLEALKTYPNYYRGFAGLAQVRAAQKRYEEAIDLYRKAIAIIPLPDSVGALGDVYMQVGRPEEARKQYDLVEYIGYLNTLNKVLYNRELAYFYADHDMKLRESLELAKKELEVRRDIYAYDVLAWALYKNELPQEAAAAAGEALKLGTKDAKLFFHAGMIYHRLGEAEKAQQYLQRALSTNPYFHIFHADVAQRTLTALRGNSSLAVASGKADKADGH